MNTGIEIAPRSVLPRSVDQPVIWVIDGEAAVRQSMQALIESAGWRARTCASAADFLTQPRPTAPNCLLLDVQLPDVSGLDLQAQMIHRPETPLIFIATHSDVSMSVRAMKAGAIEFLTKPTRNEVILSTVDHALAVSATTLRDQSEVSLLRRRHALLTRREREVLELVVQGYLNKQIGYELGISEITVKAHRGRVMRKMAATSLPQLVNMATDLDINPSPPASFRRRRFTSQRPSSVPDLHHGQLFSEHAE